MPRQPNASVPTEIMRSLVSIAEAGSISKAARALGMSQPAISAQLRRIEDYVGGSIFQKTAHGSEVTELGKVVLIQARKILEANSQLQLLRGAQSYSQTPRIGLSDLYAGRAFANIKNDIFADVSIVADNSPEIIKSLVSGFIDIGLFAQVPGAALDPSITVLRQQSEDIVWVRAPDFVLSPGAPIPLLSWGGKITHELMIHALEKAGLIYRIAFSSPDQQTHLEAAGRGLGVTVLPKRLMPATLVEAREYYLPPLPPVILCLGARDGLDLRNNKYVNAIAAEFFA